MVIEEEEVVVTMAMEGVDKVMKDKEIKEEGISNKSIKKIQFALFWAGLPAASIIMTHQGATSCIQKF